MFQKSQFRTNLHQLLSLRETRSTRSIGPTSRWRSRAKRRTNSGVSCFRLVKAYVAIRALSSSFSPGLTSSSRSMDARADFRSWIARRFTWTHCIERVGRRSIKFFIDDFGFGSWRRENSDVQSA